ncbi:hypothetical protein BHM03_00032195 [Ensete ventricosum]|nr:hypothetical protein BHM03_00032195 [Ensete ventricosum]
MGLVNTNTVAHGTLAYQSAWTKEIGRKGVEEERRRSGVERSGLLSTVNSPLGSCFGCQEQHCWQADGNLKPYRKSEPIPEGNNEPVKIVVADTLQEVVFGSGKNGSLN